MSTGRVWKELTLYIFSLWAVCLTMSDALKFDDEDCDYAPEIVLVQDVTDSWQVAIENMARSMPAVFDMLSKKFPGTKFGIVSFKDDPACGYRSDFCAHLDQSLLSPGATDMAGTQKVVEGLYPGGGMDPSENFFGAIARAVLSPQVGWTPPDQVYDAQGRPILRLLIATTDCPSHMPKQKSKCWDKRNKHHDITIFSPKPNFAPFPTRGESSWLAEDINARCGADSFEYPDPIDVTQLMKERNIMPIYLFARGTAPTTRHQPNETFKYADYFNFASKFHYKENKYPQFFDPHFDDGFMQLMKQWFSDHLHEEPIIENMDDTMSDFPALLEKTITESLRRKCLQTTTTTTTRATTSETRATLATTASVTTTTPAITTTATAPATTVTTNIPATTTMKIGTLTPTAGAITTTARAPATTLTTATPLGTTMTGAPIITTRVVGTTSAKEPRSTKSTETATPATTRVTGVLSSSTSSTAGTGRVPTRTSVLSSATITTAATRTSVLSSATSTTAATRTSVLSSATITTAATTATTATVTTLTRSFDEPTRGPSPSSATRAASTESPPAVSTRTSVASVTDMTSELLRSTISDTGCTGTETSTEGRKTLTRAASMASVPILSTERQTDHTLRSTTTAPATTAKVTDIHSPSTSRKGHTVTASATGLHPPTSTAIVTQSQFSTATEKVRSDSTRIGSTVTTMSHSELSTRPTDTLPTTRITFPTTATGASGSTHVATLQTSTGMSITTSRTTTGSTDRDCCCAEDCDCCDGCKEDCKEYHHEVLDLLKDTLALLRQH